MKIFTKEWYLSGCPTLDVSNNPDLILDKRVSSHDCKIVSDSFYTNHLDCAELELDNSGGFCAYDKIVFSDCLIKEKCNLEGAWCIAEEIYHKYNGRYEYHFLLQKFIKNKMVLDYFTVNCKSLEFFTKEGCSFLRYE